MALTTEVSPQDMVPASSGSPTPVSTRHIDGRVSTRLRALAWTTAAICTVASVTGIVFELITRSTQTPVDFGSRDAATASAVVFVALPIVGALAATRRAGRLIGWLFIAVGATMAAWVLADGLAVYSLRTHPGAFAGGRWLAWFANWVWIPGWGLLALAVLVFPTGHLPTPQWRWVAWVMTAVTIAFAVTTAFAKGPLSSYIFLRNPAGVFDLGVSARTAKAVGYSAMCVGGLVVLDSLFFRRRRAAGDEREQIKWLTWAMSVTIAVILAFAVFEGLGGRVHWAEGYVPTVSVLIPVAAGIAVLKYRLYGIDVVINKTVVFAALAVFITAVYSVVVVGVGALLGAPRTSPALSIVATAFVAFAFEPVRSRAQRLANRIVYGERATPYEIMSAFSERVSDTFASESVLDRMVTVVAQGVAAREAAIWLHSDSSLRAVAHWPGHGGEDRAIPFPRSDGPLPPLPGGHRAFPVRHDGELLGAFTVSVGPGDHLDPTREKLLADLALQAGLVLRNVRLIAELRASRQRMVAAGDAERRRLERNLHDGAQQQLVSLAIKLRLAQDMVADDPDEARVLLDALREEAAEALANLRDLARGIYPPLLADEGLVTALRSQAAKAAVPVEVDAENVDRYPQEVEAAVYFCCLEALQNVAKYANARSVVLRLEGGDRHVTFVVNDDGQGFDPAMAKGSGLQNMADRLAALDGTLAVDSSPGHGTTLTGRIPTP